MHKKSINAGWKFNSSYPQHTPLVPKPQQFTTSSSSSSLQEKKENRTEQNHQNPLHKPSDLSCPVQCSSSMASQNGIMVATTRAFIILFLLSSPFFNGIQLKLVLGVEISRTQKQMVTILQEKQGFRGKGYNNKCYSFLGWKMKKNERRLMIGSTAPICTYNECRGCRFKCRAEQIPVDSNDPINSAYHYRCVCHR